MAPDIAILDFGSMLLAPAIEMARCGLPVRIFVPGLRGGPGPAIPDYVRVAVDFLGPRMLAEPVFDADVVIWSESFSDAYWALLHGQQLDAPLPFDPLATSIHPHQLERRLDRLGDRLGRIDHLVAVDMSDLAQPLHPAFLELGSVRLKRECDAAALALGVVPFPFLFHPVLLGIDVNGEDARYRSPDAAPERDGWFCGTVDHWRYQGRRRRALETMLRRHAGARFEVRDGGVPLPDNLAALQRSRVTLHPPGRGELCFRTHEALSYGVPPLVAEPFGIAMPRGHERVFVQSLGQLPSRAETLAFYRDAYHPAVAAGQLLAPNPRAYELAGPATAGLLPSSAALTPP